MVRLYGLLFLINLVLTIIALIDCLSTEEGEVRSLPRVVWVFIILLFSPVGPIVWFVAGRPQRLQTSSAEWRPGSGFLAREQSRPLAPDDDPDFLRNRATTEDEELFRKWEADLRRREDDLRRRERGVDNPDPE